ncbi:MAG: hypothetical protein GC161_06270 [Planctomycetaceae bacterium]|nr:hypothetical protein [Planctomycetaceae bacterium]
MLVPHTSASTGSASSAPRTLRHTCTFAAALALALFATDSAQAQWVVSAAGDGDFTNLQEAIDQAAPGDTIFVLPGTYALPPGESIEIDKALSILGQPGGPKPFIQSPVNIQGAPSFQLQNLRVRSLQATDVPGRSIIDSCEIVLEYAGYGNVSFIDTGDLLVEDSSIRPSNIFGPVAAISVDGASRVQVVNSTLQGVTWVAQIPGVCIPFTSSAGGPALQAKGTSEVIVAASTVRGGFGAACLGGSPSSIPANAIVAEDSAVVHVRGNASHLVSGANAVVVSGNAEVIWSGVTLSGGASAAQPDPDVVPFLRTTGGQQPGETVTVQFYGQAGQLGFLLVGLQPEQLEIPGLLTAPLGVAPGNLLVVTHTQLLGLNTPAEFPFLLPPIPQLAGLAVYAQGVQPKPNGDWLATNVSATLLTN